MDKRRTTALEPSGNPVAELGLQVLADKAFQEHILQGISRSFACSLPVLPDSLRAGVANIYLLDRVSQIIGDAPKLECAGREQALRQLQAAVLAELPTAPFTAGLLSQLHSSVGPADRELVRNLSRVLRVTHNLPAKQRKVVENCIGRVCETRLRFQPLRQACGLPNLALFDEYCQGTAGAVTDGLSGLLCHYSADIARHSAELTRLGPSFGQGIQAAHLLKSLWEDRGRGVCWLPRDIFLRHGCSLEPGAEWAGDPAFQAGLADLIGKTCGHLRDGLAYTLLIPRREEGIRRFCIWPVGMALVILQRLHHNMGYSSGEEVKIPQSAVKAVVTASRFTVSRDWLLKKGFTLAGWGLAEESARPPLRKAAGR